MKAMIALALSLFIGSYAMAHGHDMDDKFKMMDTDKDGKISESEHAAGATEMFKKMDANTDNRVTVEEMEAAHKMKDGKGTHHKDWSAAKKISMVDTDGDKVISSAEHEAASKKMFAEMDKDKDKFLTEKELKEGHKEKMKH